MVFGNNRGNVMVEGITVIVLIAAFALFAIFGYSMFNELNSGIQNDATIAQEGKDVSSGLFSRYASLFDNLFLLLFSLGVVFVIISAFLVDTHPILFVVALFVLIAVVVAAMEIANAYDDIVTDDTVISSANQFPYMAFVMGHLGSFAIGISFLVLIIMFIKFKS